VSELSPARLRSCHVRHILVALLALGCSANPPPPQKPTEEKDPFERKPIESHRLNAAEPRVNAEVNEPPPLVGFVQIKTWANEVVIGRVLAEDPDAYVLDVAPRGADAPKTRRVLRSAVMELVVKGEDPRK
jgi:hypothetical protein